MKENTYCGIGLLIVCVIYVMIARQGHTVEDRDISAVFFLVPMALSLLFSKHKSYTKQNVRSEEVSKA